MTERRLLIASNNAHKVTEFQRLLGGSGYTLVTPRDIGLELDVEETGRTFTANARLKALAFAQASGITAMADDSGIEADALGGRPGVLSARYGGPGLDDEGRVQLLLRELDGVPEPARTCRYKVVLVLMEPDGYHHLSTEGSCEGVVAPAPSGSNGFGYDPVFYVPEYGKTVAEMSPDEKDAISHRGQATRAMALALASYRGTSV
ncbi:MAG: RdgB/HAM1 family non-canonical purine NTP pyrophosphatase [Dehalococcoidia bacterium]